MKKWLGWIAAIFVFSFISVQLLFIFYHDALQLKVERIISRRVNAHVRFEDIQLSMWHDFPNVTVDLRNFVVTGRKEFHGDTLVSMSSLGVELDVFRFFKDEIKLKSVFFDEPVINLLVLENGHANYDVFKSKTDTTKTDTSLFHVDIEQFIINDGNLKYEDRINKALIHISDFQHKGNGNFVQEVFDYSTTTFFRELSIDYDDVRYLDKKQTSVDLSMKIDTRTNKFTILENSIAINHFKVGLEGWLMLLPNGYDVDLRFAAHETSLKNILSVMPGFFIRDMEHIKTGGEASFHGFVTGKYLNNNDTLPAFRVALTVSDGFFKIDSLPASLNKIQCELLIDHPTGTAELTSLDLQTIHFELGDQPVHGRIKVEGLDRFKIDADLIAGLNLHEIETFYPLKGIQVKGRADLEFKAKGNFVRGIENGPNKREPQVPPFSIDLRLKEGSFKYDSLPAGITDASLHIIAKNPTGKVEDTSFHLEEMSMKLDETNLVTGFVRVDGFDDFRIDADIKANLDISDLERIFPIKDFDAKGNMNVEFKAKGDYYLEKGLFPLVDANFDLTNGYLKSVNYPEPIKDIHFVAEAINTTGKIANTQLVVKQLTYTLEDEPFTVTGSITDFDKYEYDFKIKGDVDLEKITKIYPIEGMTLSGKIFTRMETKGKLGDLETENYQAITNTGGFRIKEFHASGDKIPLPVYIKEANIRLSPEKIILKSLDGSIGKSHMKVTGDLFNYMYFLTKNDDLIKGDLVLECDTLDLNEWMPAVKKKTDTSDTVKSATPTQIAVMEIPKNVEFVFDSDIKHVFYDDLKITSLDGEINIKDGVMTLHETGFNSLDAKFRIDGDYDTRDKDHPLFDIGINIEELDIAKAYKEIKLIRDMAPAASDCEGQFSIDYKLKGELAKDMNPKLETIVGGGRLRIANAKIDGMKIFEELSKAAKRESMNNPHLKDFVMDTEIHDNRLYVKPFSIKVSGFNTEIEGVSEMSGAIQYLLKIELLPIEGMKIPFHVTGTYDNPKVAIGKGHKLPE